MSIIFTLCTFNSAHFSYYYNVKTLTYMVYFSIIIVVYFSITIYTPAVQRRCMQVWRNAGTLIQ